MAVFLAPYRNGSFLEATQSSVYFIDASTAPTSGTFVAGDLAIITPVFGGVAPASSSPLGYRCVTSGSPGTWVAIGQVTMPSGATDGIVAHAGGGQASATQLTSSVNRIATVATSADSVALPASSPGLVVTVINDSATACQVFGVTPDTINDVATGTGISLAGNTTAFFACPVAGKWYSVSAGSGVVASAQLNPNTIQFVSTPLTLVNLTTLANPGLQIIAAQGSGTLIEVASATLNLAFGSANFTGTGIAQLSYGNATTVAASATIAASFFTSFAANQTVLVGGALAATASASILNKAIWFNANANFASGTGATGTLDVAYRVHSGLS